MARRKVKVNKKRVVLFTTLLAICIVVLIICIVITNKLKKRKEYEDGMAGYLAFQEQYLEETIIGRNSIMLNQYKGYYSKTDLYKDLKKFTTYMYYLKDNIALASSEKFFEAEKSNIKNRLGITTYANYKKFISELEGYNISEENFRYCKFISGSTFIGDYFTFDIELYYKDENEQDFPVRFTVGWAYYSTNDIDVKYAFSENK